MTYDDIIQDCAEFSKIFKAKQMERVILACLKDLSQKTFAQTEELTFLTVAGVAEYTLNPSSNTQVFGLSTEARKATLYAPQPTTATATSGGTLAADTYSYRVTAIKDSYGETLPCTAVTQITTGATSTVTLTWTAISGASGYRVYGRTSGSELLLKELSADVLTWTDTAALTPAGTLPTTTELVEMILVSNTPTLNDRNSRWRATESNGSRILTYDGYSTVRLSDIPTTSGLGYQVKAAVYPTAGTSATAIPNCYEHYKDTIQDYVKWQFYDYPGTAKDPWANPGKAKAYRTAYMAARANMMTRVMWGFAGSQNVNQQYFASGGSRYGNT